jgi:hypothetical protein
LITPPVGHYKTVNQYPYELVHQNIVVLFRGVRIGFKHAAFRRNLTTDDFRNFMTNDLILKSSLTILEAFFVMEFLALVIKISAQVWSILDHRQD